MILQHHLISEAILPTGGYGTRWRRGMVLLRQGVLCVIDDVTLGPGQQSSGREFIAGPMFSLNSG